MSWIDIITNELPRLRLYASAALGSTASGDLAVEAALATIFAQHLTDPPERVVLFRRLDHQVRRTSAMPDSEREELLKHVGGFAPVEAAEIVRWGGRALRRSAG